MKQWASSRKKDGFGARYRRPLEIFPSLPSSIFCWHDFFPFGYHFWHAVMKRHATSRHDISARSNLEASFATWTWKTPFCLLPRALSVPRGSAFLESPTPLFPGKKKGTSHFFSVFGIRTYFLCSLFLSGVNVALGNFSEFVLYVFFALENLENVKCLFTCLSLLNFLT